MHARLFVRSVDEREQAFRSFSQFGEDAVLNSLLGEGLGTYVDVGSGHPIRGSNSYALYERGWQGLLIDPIPANVEQARRERPRDRVIQACCGRETGTTQFFEYETYEYSTSSPERVDAMGEPSLTYDVPVVTLASLGLVAKPSEQVVLSIDVEGAELDVLEGNDWEAFTPQFVVVEEWDGPLGRVTPLFEYLTARSYVLVAVTGFSSIYRQIQDTR